MMSQLEIIYLSLFLDQYGWELEEVNKFENMVKEEGKIHIIPKINFEENLLFISLFVKVILFLI